MDNPILAALQAHDFAQARALLEPYIKANPDQPHSWIMLCSLECGLGNNEAGRAAARKAVALVPGNGPELCNVALMELRLEAHDPCQLWARRAVFAMPWLPDSYAVLSALAHEKKKFLLAETFARKAICIEPRIATYYLNIANTWIEREDPEQTGKFLVRTLSIEPFYTTARFQLGLWFLTHGDLEQGFEHYEWRLVPPTIVKLRPYNQPWWDGKSKKQILVWSEQGIGDELAFGSLLSRMPSGCAVEVDRRLVSIFKRSCPQHNYIGRVKHPIALGAQQISFGSLPRAFRLRNDHKPRAYLVRDEKRTQKIRDWMNNLPRGLRIGIAWRSRKDDVNSNRFHFKLDTLDPILRIPGVVFIPVQYGDIKEEVDAARLRTGAMIYPLPLYNLFHDLEAALALGSLVNLQISTGTTAAYFGGLAGTETWMLLPRSDYTLYGRSEHMWFPNARVFLRPLQGKWEPVVEEVAEALRHMINGSSYGTR